MKKVLLTGASGFLGSYILDLLLERNCEVYAISRRMQGSLHPRLHWIQADLTDEGTLIRPEVLGILKDVEMVIHAAALYELDASHEDFYRHNVLATSNILNMTRQLPKVIHFAYTSTIAIAGDSHGKFHEGVFDLGQNFPEAYASTKFAAEHMVRSAFDLKQRSIFRLGVLVGSSRDGRIPKIDGPYYMQRAIRSLLPVKSLIERLKFLPIPFGERSRIYPVPVDYAAEAIVRLLERRHGNEGLDTFHIIGGRRGVSVRHMLSTILEHYHIDADPVPIPEMIFPAKIFKLFQIPSSVHFYMNHSWTFTSERTEQELRDLRFPSYRSYAPLILRYADAHLFQEGDKT